MKKKCNICLEIKVNNLKSKKCSRCYEGFICDNCYQNNKNNPILKDCIVCNKENWCDIIIKQNIKENMDDIIIDIETEQVNEENLDDIITDIETEQAIEENLDDIITDIETEQVIEENRCWMYEISFKHAVYGFLGMYFIFLISLCF